MPCRSFVYSELNESGRFQFAGEAIHDLCPFFSGNVMKDIADHDHVEGSIRQWGGAYIGINEIHITELLQPFLCHFLPFLRNVQSRYPPISS